MSKEKLDEEDIKQIQALQLQNCISLNKEMAKDTDDHSELLEFVPDTAPTPLQVTESLIISEKMQYYMSKALTPREEAILRLRFGFEKGYPFTLQQIADMYGVSRERIRQIENKAMTRLREALKRNKINKMEDFLR